MSASSTPASAAALPDARDRLGYAGDIDPQTAYALLSKEQAAVLIDVRTVPEWNFVGLPDLSQLHKQVLTVEWQRYPGMELAADFNQQVEQMLADLKAAPDAPLIFLCRSGVRSRSAAISMTKAGHARCYNLAGGFEGDLGPDSHRGGVNGWKHAGLPWRQR